MRHVSCGTRATGTPCGKATTTVNTLAPTKDSRGGCPARSKNRLCDRSLPSRFERPIQLHRSSRQSFLSRHAEETSHARPASSTGLTLDDGRWRMAWCENLLASHVVACRAAIFGDRTGRSMDG